MCEVGENCLKYLKRGWNRKDGRGNKDFKKEDKLGQDVGALKGRAGTPLRTMSRILKKIVFGKMGQKWTKNRVLGFIGKFSH